MVGLGKTENCKIGYARSDGRLAMQALIYLTPSHPARGNGRVLRLSKSW